MELSQAAVDMETGIEEPHPGEELGPLLRRYPTVWPAGSQWTPLRLSVIVMLSAT